MKYIALHYLALHSGSSGLGFPLHLHLYLCGDVFIDVKLFLNDY